MATAWRSRLSAGSKKAAPVERGLSGIFHAPPHDRLRRSELRRYYPKRNDRQHFSATIRQTTLMQSEFSGMQDVRKFPFCGLSDMGWDADSRLLSLLIAKTAFNRWSHSRPPLESLKCPEQLTGRPVVARFQTQQHRCCLAGENILRIVVQHGL